MKELNNIGKYMSLILRHNPEKENLILDKNGYTDVDILLSKLNISIEQLDWIVDNNNKKRFSYNNDKTKIRANQGHSIDNIDLEFEIVKDIPEFLYHGTAKDISDLILKEGIKKMNRNYVHLSKDIETASNVGKRKSKNVIILTINSKKFVEDGNILFISKNGVYLADYIPAKYII